MEVERKLVLQEKQFARKLLSKDRKILKLRRSGKTKDKKISRMTEYAQVNRTGT